MSENAARGSMQADLRHERGGAFGILLTPTRCADVYEDMHMHAHAVEEKPEQYTQPNCMVLWSKC